MTNIKRCPHCEKCYFPISSDTTENEKCPFCGKQPVECPEFLSDLFGGFNQ